jgi:hypothetical protein
MDLTIDSALSVERLYERTRLVYILGATHSGSTALAMQLAGHPDVCSIGELSGTRFRAEPGYQCGCGRELVQCGFWQGVSAAMARRGFSYSATTAETDVRNAPSRYARRLLRPMHRGRVLEWVRDGALHLSAAARAHLRRHQQLAAALAESILECSGDALLVDSSKLGLHLKYHLANPRFDVKVVWIVRDGRAVARSLMQNEGVTMPQAARAWRRFQDEGEAIARRLDRSQWRQVRYEALCTDRDGTLGELWRFMGLRPAPTNAAPARELHVLGHYTRLNGSAHMKLEEKWRSELSPAELQSFEALAGRTNRELGYA